MQMYKVVSLDYSHDFAVIVGDFKIRLFMIIAV